MGLGGAGQHHHVGIRAHQGHGIGIAQLGADVQPGILILLGDVRGPEKIIDLPRARGAVTGLADGRVPKMDPVGSKIHLGDHGPGPGHQNGVSIVLPVFKPIARIPIVNGLEIGADGIGLLGNGRIILGQGRRPNANARHDHPGPAQDGPGGAGGGGHGRGPHGGGHIRGDGNPEPCPGEDQTRGVKGQLGAKDRPLDIVVRIGQLDGIQNHIGGHEPRPHNLPCIGQGMGGLGGGLDGLGPAAHEGSYQPDNLHRVQHRPKGHLGPEDIAMDLQRRGQGSLSPLAHLLALELLGQVNDELNHEGGV